MLPSNQRLPFIDPFLFLLSFLLLSLAMPWLFVSLFQILLFFRLPCHILPFIHPLFILSLLPSVLFSSSHLLPTLLTPFISILKLSVFMCSASLWPSVLYILFSIFLFFGFTSPLFFIFPLQSPPFFSHTLSIWLSIPSLPI